MEDLETEPFPGSDSVGSGVGVLDSFKICAGTSDTRVGDSEGNEESSVFILELGLTSISLDVVDMKQSEDKGSALVLCGARP